MPYPAVAYWNTLAPVKLIVAIVSGKNAKPVVEALLVAGFRATRIDSAGGFLRRENATLLVGVEAADVDRVIDVIRQSARPHQEKAGDSRTVAVGAATLFVIDLADMQSV